MKRIILTLAVAVFSVAVHAQTQAPTKAPQQAEVKPATNPNAAEIVFEAETIDYGTIEHASNGEREFKFKNKGKEPLIISNCAGSCGCTVPTWPKEPIMPGKKGVIKVKYDTNRQGHFEKAVTVTTNAKNNPVTLHIKGDVKPPAAQPQQQQATPAPTQH